MFLVLLGSCFEITRDRVGPTRLLIRGMLTLVILELADHHHFSVTFTLLRCGSGKKRRTPTVEAPNPITDTDVWVRPNQDALTLLCSVV